MLRTKFFHKILHTFRHRNADGIELYSSGDADAASTLCSSNTEVQDLSYDDALLDTQARLFLRSEAGSYHGSADPSKAFSGVMARIEAHTSPEALSLPERSRISSTRALRTRRWSPDLPQMLRRALSGATAYRLVPSGVALLLLLMVLGTDVARLLRTEDLSQRQDVSAEQHDDMNELLEGSNEPLFPARNPARLPQPQYNTPDAVSLHPVELGMKPSEREMWMKLAPEQFNYKRTRFGPE